MGGSFARKALAITLLALFAISTQSYYFDNQYHHEINEHNSEFSTPLGQATTISIGSYPNGAVEKVSVSVPDGEVIQSMDLELESAPLLTSTAFSITDSVDFSIGTSYELVNVNNSFLSIFNTVDQTWDFDNLNGSLPPEFSISGTGGEIVVNDLSTGPLTQGLSNGGSTMATSYFECGTEGSSGGGSLHIFGGQVNLESIVYDLSGISNSEISFWVLQGHDNTCGETPEAGENLQFQYFNSNSNWVNVPSANCNPTTTCPSISSVSYTHLTLPTILRV